MADNTEQNTDIEENEDIDTEEVDVDEDSEDTDDEPVEDAFAEERAKLRGVNRKVRVEKRALAKEIKALKAQLASKDKPAEDSAIDEAKREAAAEVTQRAHEKILKSEIRAAATGRFADPKDALAFLDLTEFEVDENSDVDGDAIEEALSELLEKKPHLAAATQKRFQGGGHQGARAKARPGQVSESELAHMTPNEIVKAEKSGRLDSLLGKK